MRNPTLPLVLLVVVLSGCQAGPPAPTPSPTPTPTAPPTAGASGVAAPIPAYDIDCATAIPAEAFVGLFGTDALADTGHVEAPIDPTVIALRQVGGTSCAWTDDRSVDNQAIPVGLYVSVVPDDAKGYNAWIRAFVNRPPGIDDAAGDDSFQWCANGTCGFEMLVGTARVQGVIAPDGGEPDAAALTPVMVAMAAAVEAGGPERLPVLAESSEGWGDCQPGDPPASVLEEAWGLHDVEVLENTEDWSTAVGRVGLHFCHIIDEAGDAVVVRLIPGAAWAVDEILADPPSSTFYNGTYAPATVWRASPAAWVCAEPGCKALVAVGDDLLVVRAVGIDDEFMDRVSGFIRTLPPVVYGS